MSVMLDVSVSDLAKAVSLERVSDISGISDTDLCRVMTLWIVGVISRVSVMILPWVSRDVMASLKDCDSVAVRVRSKVRLMDSVNAEFSAMLFT